MLKFFKLLFKITLNIYANIVRLKLFSNLFSDVTTTLKVFA